MEARFIALRRRRDESLTPVAENLTRVLEWQNRAMVAVDLALGVGALAAPDRTLRLIGHADPSADARWLFRRCGPIWLTFAAAHALAAAHGRPEDWWALAWLRATELATEPVWTRSPAFRNPAARRVVAGTAGANFVMAIGFAYLARHVRSSRPTRDAPRPQT